MESKAYPDGVSDFKALVTGNYHFVDKTLMIRDLCGVKNQTMLFTRPRRFGKSMNLSMLDYFFNIRYADEPDIFEGLKISSCESCRSYRNAYPVIKLNFGDFSCYSGEELLDCIRSMNDSLANDILRYIDSGKLSVRDTQFLERCSDPSLNRIDTLKAVRKMCGLLRSAYGRKVLILVDEYDYCIQNIHSREAYDSVISELRPFMEQTFKFNEDCEFAVVTGIMPLAKTSMLSSFNNANVCSIPDSRGEEYFGFTEAEVSELLESTGNGSGCLSEIRRWYDGYRFGDADVYNPYSVMMYLSRGRRTEAYWNNMTGGGLSEDILSNMGAEPLIELKGLREKTGSEILSPISTRIAYTDIITPPPNLMPCTRIWPWWDTSTPSKRGRLRRGFPSAG